jgi:general secretion pathway protein G
MKSAFSLMELIFAVVIIAILASVGIPKLLSTKGDAVISTVKHDVRMLTTSLQTHYLVNGKIENISDAISLNSSFWNVQSKKAIFKDNDKECIILEVIEDNGSNQLNLTIDASSSNVCMKLSQSGIRTTSYELY